jgi:hypothetical protein
MAALTIIERIVKAIWASDEALTEVLRDVELTMDLLYKHSEESGIYYLYMHNAHVFRILPFLVEEETINEIKAHLNMPDNHWRTKYNRSSIEEIAQFARIELSGRPIITWK